MITKLARRLGFQPSVPVSLVDGWTVPPASAPVELAPRGGRAALHVDATGRVQPHEASWSLDWTLAAGARWLPVAHSERVTQRLVGAAVIETTVETPSGSVVQRVGAAVVDGKPVGLVEIENQGGVAVAVGLVVRPLTLGGRGHIGTTEIEGDRLSVDGDPVMRFLTQPAATRVASGADGDLLQHMPAATDGLAPRPTRCRSGGAQAAAVWPLPHTATLRLVIELDGTTSPEAAVPTLADVNRGWRSHLDRGLRIAVDDTPIAEGLSACARSLLTMWPRPDDCPAAVTALAELGFGADSARLFPTLERVEDDAASLAAIARWAQLSSHPDRLAELDSLIGTIGRATHRLSGRPGTKGPPWMSGALSALADAVREIDQPEVADRITSMRCLDADQPARQDGLVELETSRDERWSWGAQTTVAAARYVMTARRMVIDDRVGEVRLLPTMPTRWRGRSIDVLGVPVHGGSLSFGIRWHGSRPALLWEVETTTELSLSVPAIDPSFTTTERSGEALLVDPGWSRA